MSVVLNYSRSWIIWKTLPGPQTSSRKFTATIYTELPWLRNRIPIDICSKSSKTLVSVLGSSKFIENCTFVSCIHSTGRVGYVSSNGRRCFYPYYGILLSDLDKFLDCSTEVNVKIFSNFFSIFLFTFSLFTGSLLLLNNHWKSG